MKTKLLTFCIALFLVLSCATPNIETGQAAQKKHPERWYQDKWCAEKQGVVEYVLPDRTRVDCLTDEYAVEVDFASASKWYESITQALHYAMLTGRQAAILLIVEKPRDRKYVNRARR
ncbi:MAG TPA: hypothetical protein ENI07_17710 [Desulfobacterales bacterium]|nr:hypothetical protein [Desulfobacterales bacterium]